MERGVELLSPKSHPPLPATASVPALGAAETSLSERRILLTGLCTTGKEGSGQFLPP